MWKSCVVCLLVFACINGVYNKPALKPGLSECYKQKCPENTVACQRKSEVSEDRSTLLVEVSCLDINNNALRSVNLTEDNPFDKNTYFQGFSFSGVYDFTNDNVGSVAADEEPSTSDNKKEVEPSVTNSKSEVEDLNGST